MTSHRIIGVTIIFAALTIPIGCGTPADVGDEVTAKQTELNESVEAKQAIIDKQLTTITELTSQSSDNQRLEQQNRELGNLDNTVNEVDLLDVR